MLVAYSKRIQAFFREVNTYPQMSAVLALPASRVPSFNTPGVNAGVSSEHLANEKGDIKKLTKKLIN